MAKLTISLIAFLVTIGLTVGQQCGISSVEMRPNRKYDPSGRIVGGTEVKPNSHPWIVSLQEYGSHFCGGTLIRVHETKQETDIVVTAAHCVYDGTFRLTVSAGAHDLERPTSTQQTVTANRTKYYPAYDPKTTLNDIAVVVLDKPIKFTSTVQPACLPASESVVPDGTEATVAGWGLTSEKGSDSTILMQVGVPIINSTNCAASYKPKGITIDKYSMICAGYPEGKKDACQGDSGGPFVVKNGDAYTLQGVVSFGVGCARPGLPGVYARVSNYVRWLQTQISAYSSVKYSRD